MFPPAKAGGFSLRGLGRENFRPHYFGPCADRPLPDVQRCVGVCVGLVAARDAAEGGLVWAVALVDAAAGTAFPRSIPGIDKADRNPGALCLIGQEATELSERPVTKPRSRVAASGRNPCADASEIFQGQAASGAFSIRHKRLRYAVIDVFLVSPLFARELTQPSFRSLGAALLETPPTLPKALAPLLNLGAGIDAPVTVSRERHDAEINPKPILSLELIGFRDIAGSGEIPFAAHHVEIDFALLEGKEAALMIAHDACDGDTAFEGPYAGGGATLDEPKDALIVRLRAVRAEHRRDRTVDLEGVRNLGDCADCHLSGEAEAGADICIGQFVHVILAMDAHGMGSCGQPRRSFVTACQRRGQARGLFRRRQKLHGGYELHGVKYREDAMQCQEPRAAHEPLSLCRGEY